MSVSKKIQKKIIELQNLLQSEIEGREAKYDDRSERWKYSDKGYDYNRTTEYISYANDALMDCMDNLEIERD